MLEHVTPMGLRIELRGMDLYVAGRLVRSYKKQYTAELRYGVEVGKAENWERQLQTAHITHPCVDCAGGCGRQFRISERRYPDGHVETVEALLARADDFRCLSCGPRLSR